MPPLATLLLYTLAGTTVGLLALLSGIPAAPLAGALLGAGLLSMSGMLEQASWPSGTRTALEIGIGTVIGTGLSRTSLDQLQTLWKPALLITLSLVLTGIVVGLWSSRLLGIDPVVVLGCLTFESDDQRAVGIRGDQAFLPGSISTPQVCGSGGWLLRMAPGT